MKRDRKSILDFLRSLFKRGNVEARDLPENVTEATVEKLLGRTLGEKPPQKDSSIPYADKMRDSGGSDESNDSENGEEGKDPDNDSENVKGIDSDKGKNGDSDKGKNGDSDKEKRKESCPYATKRAIVESIAEIRKFAEEHQLAASVLKSLLQLLAEIALGALRGKVSRNILDALLRAINYEIAIDEAFKRGHTDGRNEMIEERYPSQDDGLPHINGGILRPEGTSIFDVAAEARR